MYLYTSGNPNMSMCEASGAQQNWLPREDHQKTAFFERPF